MVSIDIPYGSPLPEHIEIGNSRYDAREVLKAIEDMEDRPILTKDKTRTHRRYYNTSFQVRASKTFGGIHIYGRDGFIYFIKEIL